jgi:hypothetical protein
MRGPTIPDIRLHGAAGAAAGRVMAAIALAAWFAGQGVAARADRRHPADIVLHVGAGAEGNAAGAAGGTRHAGALARPLVTTELDAIRLPADWRGRLLTLPLRLAFGADGVLAGALAGLRAPRS